MWVILAFCISVVEAACVAGNSDLHGSCMLIHKDPKSFKDSNTECDKHTGVMLEIKDVQKQLPTIKRMMAKEKMTEAWVGGRYEKVWHWSSNEQLNDTLIVKKTFWLTGSDESGNMENSRITLQPPSLRWAVDNGSRAISSYTNNRYRALCSCRKDSYQNCGTDMNNAEIKKKDGWEYSIPFGEELTWIEAAQACNKHSSYLVQIETEEQQRFLEEWLPQGFSYWTAGFWDGTYVSTSQNENRLSEQKSCYFVHIDQLSNITIRTDKCTTLKPHICQKIQQLQGSENAATKENAVIGVTGVSLLIISFVKSIFLVE